MRLFRKISFPFRRLWSWIKKVRYYLLAAFLILLGVWWFCLPDELFDDPTSTVLMDRDGNILGARIASDGQWRFPAREKVPYKFEQAIIQFEDRDFYDHMGFSFKAFGRALKQNIQAGEVVSGGSTISMQTIRISRKGKSRNVFEKMVEVFQSTRMEISYSKDEILAMYASNAPMGGNVVGLDAAAWRYFGTTPEKLSWAEICVLAILPNSPGLIHPGRNRDALLKKRNRLLKRLYDVKILDKFDYELAIAEPIPNKPPDLPNIAPHLMDRIIKQGKEGQIVRASVDMGLQNKVNTVVENHHKRLSKNEIHNAAVLIVNNKTGEILSYVGNTMGDDPENGNAVDVIPAPRSTGSILKPFLFAGMIHHGEITPMQLVEDVPIILSGYSPKNYNGKYDGAVPANRALAKSLNVPIVKLLKQYGVQKFHHQLKRMGMTTLHQPSSHYGLSLVLGGAEASLWDLCLMYSNMARKLNDQSGLSQLKLNSDESVPEEGKFTPGKGAIWSTFEAMNGLARPESEGLWEQFSSSQKIAWKTGTSFGFRDAWAIGVTADYTVGVWVGNADGEGRPGLIGIEAAAPVLFDVFELLPNSKWFKKPVEDMTPIAICQKSGYRASMFSEEVDTLLLPKSCLQTTACPYCKKVHLDPTGSYQVNSSCLSSFDLVTENRFVLPPIMEKYYKLKNPSYDPLPPYKDLCSNSSDEAIAVIYPKENSRIYLPKNLDGQQSKTVFEVSHRQDTLKVYWHLNDQFLGTTEGNHELSVIPEEGKHTLTLVDELGQSYVRHFEVYSKE